VCTPWSPSRLARVRDLVSGKCPRTSRGLQGGDETILLLRVHSTQSAGLRRKPITIRSGGAVIGRLSGRLNRPRNGRDDDAFYRMPTCGGRQHYPRRARLARNKLTRLWHKRTRHDSANAFGDDLSPKLRHRNETIASSRLSLDDDGTGTHLSADFVNSLPPKTVIRQHLLPAVSVFIARQLAILLQQVCLSVSLSLCLSVCLSETLQCYVTHKNSLLLGASPF